MKKNFKQRTVKEEKKKKVNFETLALQDRHLVVPVLASIAPSMHKFSPNEPSFLPLMAFMACKSTVVLVVHMLAFCKIYKIDIGLDEFCQIWTDVVIDEIQIEEIWEFGVSRYVLPFEFGLGSTNSRP